MKSWPLQQLQPSPTSEIRATVIKTEHAGIIKMDPDYDVSQIPGLDSSVLSAKSVYNVSQLQLEVLTKIFAYFFSFFTGCLLSSFSSIFRDFMF